ncbi:MAG TPA: ABC transporter ATP-binding protein [Gemmatimonadales bacterium]|nr:ABC transporter ATP-binding protein [Gemmatimonadales bacterium]
MMLEARGLVLRYPGAAGAALDGVDLQIAPGELVAVIGPNGSGKTSLLRAALGLVPLAGGESRLEGRAVGQWSRADFARVVGIVPQREESPFSWTVEEMVSFGRYARLGALAPFGRADREAMDRALERCDVRELKPRRIETLSGGEWQRVRIARALAQEPRLLALDEPTAALDLGHEMALFELMRSLATDGLACLVITHDLTLAGRYADRLLLLDRGRLDAAGPPDQVLTPERIGRVFDWPVDLLPLPGGGTQVVPRKPGPGQDRYF